MSIDQIAVMLLIGVVFCIVLVSILMYMNEKINDAQTSADVLKRDYRSILDMMSDSCSKCGKKKRSR